MKALMMMITDHKRNTPASHRQISKTAENGKIPFITVFKKVNVHLNTSEYLNICKIHKQTETICALESQHVCSFAFKINN